MGTAGRDFEERNHHDNDEQCRICANYVTKKEGVDIFDEEGKRHYLQTNIRKYLYILVSSEDKLPKMVCITCIKRLEGIHRFAMMACRTQEMLKLKLYGVFDNVDSTQDMDIRAEIRDIENSGKKIEEKSLLHSILTKGALEILGDGDSKGPPSETLSQEEHTPNTEEMEVKVDPMLFLQCGLEEPSSEMSEISDNECDEQDLKMSPTEPLSLVNKLHERKDDLKDDDNDIVDDDDDDDDKKPSEESDEDISNTSIKSHKCTICSRSFMSQISLQDHLWSHIPKERRLERRTMLKSHYSTNGVLQVNADSNASGNFICPICSKRISTKGNLKVHLETHRPKGKYGCDICGRIFKTQSNLFRHKEYHGGIQFPCNVCGRVYPTNSTLRAHSITHSDLRPHACPLCDKTFKRNQDLKFHINQHTGARPYQCPYCPKAFASSGNCFSHRKRMHPREVHRDRQRAADLMR